MDAKFSLGYHEALTLAANEASGRVLDTDQQVTVVAFNLIQDVYQWSSETHFDNCDFPGGIENIESQWQIVGAAGPGYPEAALAAFGALLHTTQDFYAHSNWVELHVDQSAIPVWDQTLDSLPSGIVSGTWWIGFPKLCGPNAPTHDQLNKDSPESTEGSKIVPSGPNTGKSLFQLAYDTALNASLVQFKRLSGVKLGRSDARAAGASPVERATQAARAFRAAARPQ